MTAVQDAPTEVTKDDEPKKPDTSKYIEHGDDVTTILFGGKRFTFPTSRAQWPTRAMQAFSRARHTDAVEILLGPEQWDLFNEVAPTIGEFWLFYGIFADAAGFTQDDS